MPVVGGASCGVLGIHRLFSVIREGEDSAAHIPNLPDNFIR